MLIEVLFSPAEVAVLPGRDLRHHVCVVFDVLRATSTLATGLANGARAFRPVPTIADALAERRRDPAVLLAGEREGRRITAAQAEGVDFDLGNSPREFTSERVAGRTIVMTTTNGTRALAACGGASRVLAASFLNLQAVANLAGAFGETGWVVVCAGTGEGAAYEDTLAAGALCAALDPKWDRSDSALIAEAAWRAAGPQWGVEIRRARNAQRLLALPDLAADVDVCLRRNAVSQVPVRSPAGELTLSLER